MSTPVDNAIAEAIKVLGPGWFVGSIRTNTVDATTYGDALKGEASFLQAGVEVILRHPTRIEVWGLGATADDALANAVATMMKQSQRQGR